MKDFVAKVTEIGLERFSFSDISRQDLDNFSTAIQEIQKLFSAYPNSYTRKQISAEILAKIKPLETFLQVISSELKYVKNECESEELVNDVELAMNLLVNLANTGNVQYALRKLSVSDSFSEGIPHGDSKRCTVWVIGKEYIVESIEDTVYHGSELSTRLTSITNDGSELIVCTDHCYATDVLPFMYSVKLEMFQIRTAGFASEIKCYVRDGALQDAVTLFRSWISQNGGNISGLKQDKLLELIRNS